MPDEFDEDYNEFLNRIKKILNIDPEKFDFDIIFLPEAEMNQDFDPNNENVKAFKVNYHYEEGMDKPEIRIEGDLDNEKLRDYFKNFDMRKLPKIKPYIKKRDRKVLDRNSITLQPSTPDNVLNKKEQYYELNALEKKIEIVMETPGVEKGHVILSLNENGKDLKIIIQNQFNEFEKIIKLPYESTLKDHNIAINNGIITIQINKK